jgi:hypothetical protein
MKLKPGKPKRPGPTRRGVRYHAASMNGRAPRASERVFVIESRKDVDIVRLTYLRQGLSRFDVEDGTLAPLVEEGVILQGTTRFLQFHLNHDGALALWAALEEALFPEDVPGLEDE